MWLGHCRGCGAIRAGMGMPIDTRSFIDTTWYWVYWCGYRVSRVSLRPLAYEETECTCER